MSFLDQISKNINMQTEFFTQIARLSKTKSDNIRGSDELEIQPRASEKIDSKTEFITKKEKTDFNVENNKNEKSEFEVKTNDKDFETTKKEIFEKEEIDNEIKSKKKNLKEELDEVDTILDLLFGALDPVKKLELEQALEIKSSSGVDLSETLKTLEAKVESSNIDPDLLDFFLGKVSQNINSKIEDLTKEIVDLDLSSEEGLKAILDLSKNLEKLQDFTKEVEALDEAIVNTYGKTDREITLEPELEILFEAKVETLLNKIKETNLKFQQDIKNRPNVQNITLEVENEKILEDNKDLKKLLENMDNLLKSLKDHDKGQKLIQASDSSALKELKVFQEIDPQQKSKTTNNIDYSKLELEMLSVKDSTKAETKSNNKDFSSENFNTLFQKTSKIDTPKTKNISKPISIKQVPEFISKEANNMKPNSKQEVKLLLNPENLGKLQLNMVKEDNHIKISLFVSSEEAANKLEQKVNEIKIALKDKGFETNIEINRAATENSTQAQQNYNQNKEDNATQERLKEKYLNQVPQWLKSQVEDFNTILDNSL